MDRLDLVVRDRPWVAAASVTIIGAVLWAALLVSHELFYGGLGTHVADAGRNRDRLLTVSVPGLLAYAVFFVVCFGVPVAAMTLMAAGGERPARWLARRVLGRGRPRGWRRKLAQWGRRPRAGLRDIWLTIVAMGVSLVLIAALAVPMVAWSLAKSARSGVPVSGDIWGGMSVLDIEASRFVLVPVGDGTVPARLRERQRCQLFVGRNDAEIVIYDVARQMTVRLPRSVYDVVVRADPRPAGDDCT